MHESFWWDTKFEILFKGFFIDTPLGLVSICLGFASLAIIFEALRVAKALTQSTLFRKKERIPENPPRLCPSEQSALLPPANQKTRYSFILGGVIFFTQETTAFILMLVVMSYNGYLAISVICGATLGYFFFGPKTHFINQQKILNELRTQGCCPRCFDYNAIQENQSNV